MKRETTPQLSQKGNMHLLKKLKYAFLLRRVGTRVAQENNQLLAIITLNI